MSYPVMPLGFLGSQGDNDTYRIERSLRFNSADSAYLSRTPASAGNRRTWTLSCWVKRSKISGDESIFDAGNSDQIRFISASVADRIRFNFQNSTTLETNAVFRDISAWYHIVLAVDTTQAVSNNRTKLYVNGIEITSFATQSNPLQNAEGQINSTSSHSIGRVGSGSYYFNGYITECYFIDGQALTPSSFGETDAITGRWKAKAYSGTYGTNGFYLKFADNSGTTSTTLGKDLSGNGNNWTPNNFQVSGSPASGIDSLVDSPTNYGTDTGVGGEVRGNYCTINAVDKGASITLSNGNLDTSNSGVSGTIGKGTFSFNSGKWYWENTINSGIGMVGIVLQETLPSTVFVGNTSNGYGYQGSDGKKFNNNAGSSYGNTFTVGDIIGVLADMDNGTLVFYKNNISQGTAFSGLSGTFCPAVGNNAANSVSLNFGQRPFAYTAPSGFKALCTTNLSQPTIKKPSSAMDVVTYTGNGSARSITGLGFSPDLVWVKGRSGATDHAIYDSVRGVQKDLGSNLTTDETTQTQGLTAFNSDGFDIGTLAKINTNTSTYVAWAWDRAAIDGLDIVSYTGNGVNRTIAHNLGVAPKMIIVKARTTAGTDQGWPVYHASLANTQYLLLNSVNGPATGADYWNSTTPTASVFSLGTNAAVNLNNDTYIAYLFSEVDGFSKFGSYTGNASSDGPFVWCGFRPRWLVVKQAFGAGNQWVILDSARDSFNQVKNELQSDTSIAEVTTRAVDFLSNGFKIRDSLASLNNTGGIMAFAAFAESAYKYARAR